MWADCSVTWKMRPFPVGGANETVANISLELELAKKLHINNILQSQTGTLFGTTSLSNQCMLGRYVFNLFSHYRTVYVEVLI